MGEVPLYACKSNVWDVTHALPAGLHPFTPREATLSGDQVKSDRKEVFSKF